MWTRYVEVFCYISVSFILSLFHIFFLPSFVEDEGDDEEEGRFLVDFHKKIYSKVWQEINVIFFFIAEALQPTFLP